MKLCTERGEIAKNFLFVYLSQWGSAGPSNVDWIQTGGAVTPQRRAWVCDLKIFLIANFHFDLTSFRSLTAEGSEPIRRLLRRRRGRLAKVGPWRTSRDTGMVATRAAILTRSSTCCTNIRAGAARIMAGAAPLEDLGPLRAVSVRVALPAWRRHHPTKACLPPADSTNQAEAVLPASGPVVITEKSTNTIDSTRPTLMLTTGWTPMNSIPEPFFF